MDCTEKIRLSTVYLYNLPKGYYMSRSCTLYHSHHTFILASFLYLEEENNLVDVCLPCFSNEAVKERVRKAVEACDSHGYIIHVVEPFGITTVLYHCMEKHCDVDGPKAEKNAKQNDCQQLQNPLTLLFLCGLVGLHHLTDPPGGKPH